ncbi:transcriptional regulator, partial [Salmonella enterica subsp. enterica serovar Lubbock]
MTKVKHHFTNKSNIACLPTGKAISYNEAMSDNTLTNGLSSRLAELNKKGFSKTEMARVAGVSKQAVSS